MRVLVTGGAGYIGSHAAKGLARSGFEPVVLDNFSTGHRHAVKWGPVIEGDLADAGLVRRALTDQGIGAILHFAASAYVGESMESPRKYFRNNVANTLNLLEAAMDAGVGYLVFSSSCATYGIPERTPIPEGHSQRPINPYGESKLMVERILRWYGEAYGLSWMALRYFNAAGADPDGELAEEHSPETHLIPLAIHAALGQHRSLSVYGADYPTPDGTAIRDYIHVTDLADAHVLALEHLLAGGESSPLNLGTGKGTSVREICLAVSRVTGRPVPVQEAGRRPGDPPALVAEASRGGEVLGWQPQYSDLETIIETAWRAEQVRHPAEIQVGVSAHAWPSGGSCNPSAPAPSRECASGTS
jgi:UDP-glucose-4-epimerase GalE